MSERLRLPRSRRRVPKPHDLNYSDVKCSLIGHPTALPQAGERHASEDYELEPRCFHFRIKVNNPQFIYHPLYFSSSIIAIADLKLEAKARGATFLV